MSEPNDKTKVAWLELEVKNQRDRIAELESAIEQTKEAEGNLERQNAELRDVVRWSAATLQIACRMKTPIREQDRVGIDDAKRTVAQVLDAADAALAADQKGKASTTQTTEGKP